MAPSLHKASPYYMLLLFLPGSKLVSDQHVHLDDRRLARAKG